MAGIVPATPSTAWSTFFAALYDPLLWRGERRPMRGRRRELLAQADGRVLEIGAGTGLNAPLYPAGRDARVGPRRSRGAPVRRRVVRHRHLDDGALHRRRPGRGAGGDPPRAAAGGRLLFIEHVRAGGRVLGWIQDRAGRPWRAFAEGCRCNRDTLALLEKTFDRTEAVPARWLAMPPLVRPLVSGASTV